MNNRRLIEALQNLFEVDDAVPVGRGALGIYAALKAWGGTGGVAIQANVCHDIIAAILMAGRQPIFCDVDPATGHATTTEWVRARSLGADAAIVVHLYGNLADTASVCSVFSGALVIDDAAQAFGARNNTYLAGTGGDIGLVSFGHTKQIQAGGAALLCRDASFAKSCQSIISKIQPSSTTDIKKVNTSFRNGYLSARELLIKNGDKSGFIGLLKDYEPALKLSWDTEYGENILAQLSEYPEKLAKRREKVAYWRKSIEGTSLVPIGMNEETAPWRFACRLPGCNWRRQHKLGDLLRKNGLEVSHWYIPSYWLLDQSQPNLLGAERLANESFQFWLDESITVETIQKSSETIRNIIDF